MMFAAAAAPLLPLHTILACCTNRANLLLPVASCACMRCTLHSNNRRMLPATECDDGVRSTIMHHPPPFPSTLQANKVHPAQAAGRCCLDVDV